MKARPAPFGQDEHGQLRGLLHAGRFSLYVEEAGESQKGLVFIQGLPGSNQDFKALDEALGQTKASHLRRLRWDLPGQGISPVAHFQQDRGMMGRAELILRLCQARHLSEVVLVAYSFGGALAMCAAAQWPELVRGLVLINSTGTLPHKALTLPMPLIRRIPKMMDSPWVGQAIAAQMHSTMKKLRMPTDDEVNLAKMQNHARWVAALDFSELHQVAQSLALPVFLASARNDPIVESAVTDALIRSLGDEVTLEHLCLARGGHGLPWKKSHELATRLIPWLGDVLD